MSELSITRSSWLFGGFKSTNTFLGSTFGERCRWTVISHSTVVQLKDATISFLGTANSILESGKQARVKLLAKRT